MPTRRHGCRESRAHPLPRRHPLSARARQRHPDDGDLPCAGATRARRPLVVRPDTHAPARDPFAFYGLPRIDRLTIERAPVAGPAVARRLGYLAFALGRSIGAGRADVVLTRDLGVAAVAAARCRARCGRRSSTNRTATHPTSRQRCPHSSRLRRRQAHGSCAGSPSAKAPCGARGRVCHDHARSGGRPRDPFRYAGASCGRPRRRPAPSCGRQGLHRRSRVPAIVLVVVYAGHLYAWKGVDVLLEALAAVAGRGRADRRRARAGTGPRTCQSACGQARHRDRGDVHRAGRAAATFAALLRRPPSWCCRTRRRRSRPASRRRLKLFEYMAAGRPIVATDLPAMREVLTPDVNALLVVPGSAPALSAGIRRVLSRSGARCPARGSRSAQRYSSTPGSGAPSGSRRCWQCRRRAAMISERLLALVRCPDCRRRAARHGELVTCSRMRPARTARVNADYLDLRPRSNSRSRRSTSTRRCTPTRGTNGSRRRCSDRRSATTCCAPSSRRRPAIASSISAAAAGARCSGTATGARRRSASTSARSSPRRRARSRPAARRSAPAAVRGRHVHQGLLARRARTPVARGAARHARRSGARAGAGRRAVRLHARPEERADRGRACAGSTRSRVSSSGCGLIDMRQERLRKSDHLNPLRDIPELEQVARGAGLPHRAHPVLHADRRRVRREHPDADGRARDGAPGGAPAVRARCRGGRRREAIREARTAAKQRIASSPTTYARSARAVGRDEARPAAVRPDSFGTVLRAARERLTAMQTRDENPLLPPSIRPCPARSADRSTSGGRRRAGARSGTRCTRSSRRATRHSRAGPVRWIAMPPPLGRKELRWARRRAVRAARARTFRPTSSSSGTTTSAAKAFSRPRRVGASACSKSTRRSSTIQARAKQLLDRALLVEPMRRWRERICRARGRDRHAERRHPAARHAASKIVELEWGADTDRFRPGAAGPLPFARPPGTVAVFAGAFRELARRDPSRTRDARAARARGVERTFGAVLIGDGPGARQSVKAEAAGLDDVVFTGALPHDRMPACLAACRHRRRAVRRRTHTARCRSGSTGRRSRSSSTWRPACRSSRPPCPESPRSSAHGTKALLYDPSQPETLADALDRSAGCAVASAARRGGTRARGARLQLGGALPGARRGAPQGAAVNVLLVTDAFPPVCGGSGWSTYELARGLRARGHAVMVVQPRPGTAGTIRDATYDGFRVLEFGAPAPPIPYVRNYFKNERLLRAICAAFLRTIIQRERIDDRPRPARDDVAAVDRGRHVGGHPGGLHGARLLAGLLLVRSDSHAGRGRALPGLFGRMMTQCIQPHAGAAWPLALPMIPYMRANLRRKRTRARARGRGHRRQHDHRGGPAGARAGARAYADAHHSQSGGHRRSCGVAPRRWRRRCRDHTRCISASSRRTRARRTSCRQSNAPTSTGRWSSPATGPEEKLIADQAARSRRDIRMVGWVDQQAAAAWLAHASLLIFTSRGPESLSRVLIEASALGVPIAAMNTGGTPDIVVDKRTGLLSNTPEELARDIRRLRDDEGLRAGSARRRWRAPSSCSTPPRRRSGSSVCIRISSKGARSDSIAPRCDRRAVGVSAARTRRSRAPCLRSDPISGRRRHSGHAHHSRTEGRTRIRTRRPYDSPEAQADYGPLSDLPASRTTRDDRHRPQHRVSTIRRTGRQSGARSRQAPRGRYRPRLWRQRARVRAPARLCLGAARHEPAGPRRIRRDRSREGTTQACRVPATPEGRARLRQSGRSRDCNRSQSRANRPETSRPSRQPHRHDPERHRSGMARSAGDSRRRHPGPD